MIPIPHKSNLPIGATPPIYIGIFFIVFFGTAKSLACPLELPVSRIFIKGHPLAVELATTPKARVCGLSKRVHMPENQGMLFIYPDLGKR